MQLDIGLRYSVAPSLLLVGEAMIGVVNKFFITSISSCCNFLWIHHKLLPGITQMSPESMTSWSGILAVISVNVVIGLCIYLPIKEPSDKHEPDPTFLAYAKDSMNQSDDTKLKWD